MLGALVYLRLTSFKNWMRARLRRLRQPKYLAGALVGAAYFYFAFFRPISAPVSRSARAVVDEQGLDGAAIALPTDWLPAIAVMAAAALLLFLTLMWIVPTGPATLGFSEAEIAFLFPAPITRRALVHFRLLSAQFRSLIGAFFMMLFSNRWTVLGGSPFTHAVGWWFIFSALNLHHSGAGFTLTRLSERGIGTVRRRLVVFAFIAGMVAITVARLPAAERLPLPGGDGSLRPVAEWLVNVGGTAPLGWLLWPLQLVLAPFLASDLRAFLLALLPALAVITLHYLWVVRTAVAFEDASIEHAEKRAARIAAWRSGDRRLGRAKAKGRSGPFRLRPSGRPEIAFLWKNLLSTWPYFSVRVFAICAFVIAGACTWLNHRPEWSGLMPGIGAMAFFFGVYTLIVGPQFARQDIRTDLSNTDILKTYPLAGWQIVLGQLLTPAAILTGVVWLALLTVLLSFQSGRPVFAWLTPGVRVAGGLAFAVITPVLVLLQLLVPNAAALVFPGWFQATRTRGGGPEVVGQRMIFFVAQLLTMLAALAPAAFMASIVLFILVQWLHVWEAAAIGIAALAVFVVLAAEVWCGIWLLGQRFEKLDLSAELRP
ncbi:MAG TPA: putative ABC exporter domain-containing protein [Opitutaceae bacterium]|nr:putative ABC exporter domain-containing protein [Opitutaceae bacterium]